MTASESPHAADVRAVADRALDLLLYAPAGALLSAIEDMPAMAAKGRARLDQEVRNARVVGRFAVDFGLRQVREQLEWLTGERPRPAPAAPSTRAEAPAAPRRVAGNAGGPAAPPRRVAPAAPASEADLAIPDYDTLSASQVVRRLDGLGEAELRAVARHERATRARRTILHRAEQLLGTGPGGRAGSSGPGDDLPGA